MEPRHTNIRDPDVCVMPSAHSNKLPLVHVDHVNYPDVLKRDRLEDDEVVIGSIEVQDFYRLAQLSHLLL